MVRIHLSKLLGERRMTQKELSRLTGIRAATINDIYHEMAIHLSVENLDRICEALNCSISDLLEYVPNSIRSTGKDLIVEEHGNQKRSKRSR